MAASMVSAQESESRRKIHICIHTRGRGQGRHGCCCSATVVATLFERYGCCYSLLNLGPFQRIALRGHLAAAAPFLSFSSTNLLSRGRHCAQEHHHHHCHDLLLWVNNHKDIVMCLRRCHPPWPLLDGPAHVCEFIVTGHEYEMKARSVLPG